MWNRKILFFIIGSVILGGAIIYILITKNGQNTTLHNASETSNQIIKVYKDCTDLWPSDLCKMFISEERTKLYDICAKIEIPKTELDTSVYPNNKIAIIRWWDSNFQQNITLYLPYDPENKFSGCSESAKTILRDIQKNTISQ